MQTRHNTCDLRGMTADEALETTRGFLDRSLSQEIGVVFLIHGHGTGVLRKAVRAFCRESDYVASFRPGEDTEGGNGVTVVTLK